MNHDHSRLDRSQPPVEPTAFWLSRYAIGLVVMGAVAAYFLLSEHRAHFWGALPFLLLLACPLMHMFMHGGHGGHGDGHARRLGNKQDSNTPPAQISKTGERP